MSHTLYEAAVVRVQRCELAVPGSNPGMFEKAMKSGADFVFLDLEDAVVVDGELDGDLGHAAFGLLLDALKTDESEGAALVDVL